MNSKKRVVLVGLKPEVVDYSKPHTLALGLTPEKLIAQLEADRAKLNELGFDAQFCLVDRGETAESVVTAKLAENTFDCVMIGAGVRTDPEHFLLFEKLVNAVLRHAPSATICFNTKPADTAEAVQRWLRP